VATLLDTSALVVLVRRDRAPDLEFLARVARDEIDSGRCLLSSVTATELLVGARDDAGLNSLDALLEALPVVAVDREVATLAGFMGAYARKKGATIPLADLLIAATAVHIDVPLLTCDRDFARGRRLAPSGRRPTLRGRRGRAPGTGAELWQRFALHPASVPAA
jgi:predicted nucleic acid-binding protein